MLFRLFTAAAILSALCGVAEAQTTAQPAPAASNLSAVLPNLSPSVRASGVPGLDGAHWFIWNQPAGFDGTATLRIDRHVAVGSGVAPRTYSALLVKSSTNPGNAGFEYGFSSEFVNTANLSTTAQNVAVAGTAWKETPTNAVATSSARGDGATATIAFTGGETIPVGHFVSVSGVKPAGFNGVFKVTASSPGSVSFANPTTGSQAGAGTIVDTTVGPTWAQYGNCIDKTGVPDPIASCIGAEFDVSTYSATTDAHKQRVAVQVQAKGTAGAHAGRGVLIGTNSGVTFDRGVDFTGTYGYGIDLSAAAYTAAPIYLPNGKGVVSAGSLELGSAAGASVDLKVGGATAWSVNGAGGALTPGPAGNRNIGSAAAQVATVYAQDLQLKAYTVATLPACNAGVAGAIAYVTDAAAPSYNGALAGGASTRTLALCTGAAWTAH
jgi:hypothetical protein